MEELTREEEELYDLSDDELEAAFKAAKADDEEADETAEDYSENENENENEEAEDLEQPNKDSDDDASSEDEDDGEAEEDLDTEEGNLDGEPEAEDKQPEAEEVKSKDEEQPIQQYKFKANGREYEFTEEEIKAQFPKVFGQAMDYTRKMQAIKPYRKTIDALEQAKLSHEDVSLMIDVLKGDKEAITEVIKRTGIDALELDTENSKYIAKDYGRDEKALALKEIIEEISTDKEYEITHKVLSKDWDDESWKEVSGKPELIKALHIDVKSGLFEKVQPIAEKLKVYGRGSKSDLEYYKEAAGIYYENIGQEQRKLKAKEEADSVAKQIAEDKAKLDKVRSNQQKNTEVKQDAEKRKAAAPTKKGVGTKKSVDFLDASEDEFEEWYKKLQDK